MYPVCHVLRESAINLGSFGSRLVPQLRVVCARAARRQESSSERRGPENVSCAASKTPNKTLSSLPALAMSIPCPSRYTHHLVCQSHPLRRRQKRQQCAVLEARPIRLQSQRRQRSMEPRVQPVAIASPKGGVDITADQTSMAVLVCGGARARACVCVCVGEARRNTCSCSYCHWRLLGRSPSVQCFARGQAAGRACLCGCLLLRARYASPS